jgi:hypothetical protein
LGEGSNALENFGEGFSTLFTFNEGFNALANLGEGFNAQAIFDEGSNVLAFLGENFKMLTILGACAHHHWRAGDRARQLRRAAQVQPRARYNALAMIAAQFQPRARRIIKSTASQHLPPSPAQPPCLCEHTFAVGRGMGTRLSEV